MSYLQGSCCHLQAGMPLLRCLLHDHKYLVHPEMKQRSSIAGSVLQNSCHSALQQAPSEKRGLNCTIYHHWGDTIIFVPFQNVSFNKIFIQCIQHLLNLYSNMVQLCTLNLFFFLKMHCIHISWLQRLIKSKKDKGHPSPSNKKRYNLPSESLQIKCAEINITNGVTVTYLWKELHIFCISLICLNYIMSILQQMSCLTCPARLK